MAKENPKKRVYEVRLSGPGHEPLLFAVRLMTDDEAAEHARKLLDRHSEMAKAEIWRGKKLVRQV
jgi:hypothetical protein